MSKAEWLCPKCGEQLEAQFDSCWKCGRSRDVEGPKTDPVAQTSPDKMLEMIYKMQEQQSRDLKDLRSKVGCLYTYMIFGIVLGLIYGVVIVIAR